MGLPAPTPEWSFAQRVGFRCAFAYWIVYNLPFPLQYLQIPVVPREHDFIGRYVGWVVGKYSEMWQIIVPWVGKRLFDVDIVFRFTGSGDTTYNYVQMLCYAVFTVVLAAAWTLLDRKSLSYPRLLGGLRVYVRFALATIIMSYGAYKVIKSQFPNPSLDRLLQPYGDSSPMGLVWTFMGASEGYNIFTGGGEMLGGLLLTTRRTTLLGALVSMAVLLNVIMLNFCYDVPVKLFSVHLFAMALFLALPDLGRLANVLVFNRPAAAADIHPLTRWRWLNWTTVALRTVLVGYYVYLTLNQSYTVRQTYGDLHEKSPLYGIWTVEEFAVDGQDRPPLITDATRWRRVVFDYPNTLAVQLMSDSRQRYGLKIEEQTLSLTKRDDPNWKSDMSYQQPEPGLLVLEGSFDGKKVRAKCRRVDESEFLLVSRGFHWINEFPFNK